MDDIYGRFSRYFILALYNNKCYNAKKYRLETLNCFAHRLYEARNCMPSGTKIFPEVSCKYFS